MFLYGNIFAVLRFPCTDLDHRYSEQGVHYSAYDSA